MVLMGYSGAGGKLKIIEDKNVTQPSRCEDKNTKDNKCIWLLKKNVYKGHIKVFISH
jgi:hypothetical protein